MASLIDSIVGKSTDNQQMAILLDRALAEIDRLRLENANLRAELRDARRKLADYELRMLRRAQRDALLIGALHVAGGYTSRRACRQVGITENRWCLARALLRFGGALSKRTRRFKAETGADFERAVSLGAQIVEQEGCDVLKRGSYRHRKYA